MRVMFRCWQSKSVAEASNSITAHSRKTMKRQLTKHYYAIATETVKLIVHTTITREIISKNPTKIKKKWQNRANAFHYVAFMLNC